MKRCYIDKKFRGDTLVMIMRAAEIVREYSAMGYNLTLRQLYYQFVSKDLIANKQTEYKRLGSIINDARLAGMLDWNAIEDRTRNVKSVSHWDSPDQIVDACVRSYNIDKWEGQEYYVEVWVEKDALVDVVGRAAEKLDVPYFSCRGYVSQSEMWAASQRILRRTGDEKDCFIIHLGDHDPSGIDMTRDIQDRLELFTLEDTERLVQVKRVALTMDQIEELGPPPNPAKLTDSRCRGYIKKYGRESWELDALPPEYINELIEAHVGKYIDTVLWDERVEKQEKEREQLRQAAEQLKS